MSRTILILGGTKEASHKAAALVEKWPETRIITSLAGRTKEPKPIAGETRIGGFGGVDGLAKYIRQNDVTEVIDATHPFAKQISKNAQIAAQITGVKLTVKLRKPWQKQPEDNWIEVEGLSQACSAIPQGARVLLALGSQYIDQFANLADVFFLIRMVDLPTSPLPFQNYDIIKGKPGDVAHETQVLEDHKITHIVCRNSGGSGAYAKIIAARNLNLPVIIQNR